MTRDELVTYVQQRLTISTAETTTTTQIQTQIEQARRRVNAHFKLLRATDDLDFVADTAAVAIPSDVVEILSITRGTSGGLLQPITEQEYAQYLSTDYSYTTGPAVYVRRGASAVIDVYPAPTETETDAATLRYVQRPTALGGSDSPSELPVEFHDLIGELAIYRIAQNEEDLELARAAWANAYGAIGNPDDKGLWGDLRGYMSRTMGPTVSHIRLHGFGR